MKERQNYSSEFKLRVALPMHEQIVNEIAQCFKTLKLNREIAQSCFSVTADTNQEYLLKILKKEIQAREQRRRNRLLNTAGFYHIKTFEGYSFDGIQFPHDLTPEDVIQVRILSGKKKT